MSRALRTRQFPSKRRRAKWLADAQFRQAVRQLRPGDIAIDCGANLGRFTRPMAATGATVYAFEPDPHAFAALLRVGFGPNVHCLNQAVGATRQSAMLYRTLGFAANPDKHTESSSLLTEKTSLDHANSIQVEQIDLAAFITELPERVALLKMDIEGSEVSVIERLLDTGALDRIDRMFVETHERQMPALTERTQHLRAALAKRMNISLDWV